MDDCKECDLKYLCKSLPEDLTCEEVKKIAWGQKYEEGEQDG